MSSQEEGIAEAMPSSLSVTAPRTALIGHAASACFSMAE